MSSGACEGHAVLKSGRVLCSEQGLGKTVQMLALIVTQAPSRDNAAQALRSARCAAQVASMIHVPPPEVGFLLLCQPACHAQRYAAWAPHEFVSAVCSHQQTALELHPLGRSAREQRAEREAGSPFKFG